MNLTELMFTPTICGTINNVESTNGLKFNTFYPSLFDRKYVHFFQHVVQHIDSDVKPPDGNTQSLFVMRRDSSLCQLVMKSKIRNECRKTGVSHD